VISPVFMNTPMRVLRAGRTTDRYNVASPDWSAAYEVANVRGCIAPRSLIARAEEVKSRDLAAGEAFIYLPPGTDVTALDRVVAQGQTYEVTGEPEVYPGQFVACTGRHSKG
jgi:hypothetical protein